VIALFLACPICFGDPNSQQVHGARVGVLFLLGLTLGLLTAMALVARSWMARARELERS
jgi:hypothetical protein